MKYYLSIDSGGTKIAAILHNESFERCGVCVTGSVRTNTTSSELVKKHTEELIETLGLAGKKIEECDGMCEQSVINEIKKVCEIKREGIYGELDMGLSAAGIFGDGLLGLCGTGATVFARYKGKKLTAGGYGSAVADEGSGYYIGREALLAAIRDNEERGEHTVLTDLIPKHIGFSGAEELRKAIFSFYNQTEMSPVTCVAKCAPIVIKAAADGDEISVRILKNAGRLIAEQMCWLIKSNCLPVSLRLTISGSMWRGNPLLFNEFNNTVKQQYGKINVIIPKIEPVLGVLAKRMYDESGELTNSDVSKLLSEFPEFSYDIKDNKTVNQLNKSSRR